VQEDLRAADVGLDGAHRVLDDEAHADGGRKMVDQVDAVDQFSQKRDVGDRVDGVREISVPF